MAIKTRGKLLDRSVIKSAVSLLCLLLLLFCLFFNRLFSLFAFILYQLTDHNVQKMLKQNYEQ